MKIKVLWFTNIPSCYMPVNGNKTLHSYNDGGWMAAAEEEISSAQDVKLAVSFMCDDQPFKVESDNVIYYPISNNKKGVWKRKLYRKIVCLTGFLLYKCEESEWSYYIEQYKKIVNDFKPDIIHVWGSETYTELVCKSTEIPVVLHIQGILNPYYNAFLPPFFSWISFSFSNWSLLTIAR